MSSSILSQDKCLTCLTLVPGDLLDAFRLFFCLFTHRPSSVVLISTNFWLFSEGLPVGKWSPLCTENLLHLPSPVLFLLVLTTHPSTCWHWSAPHPGPSGNIPLPKSGMCPVTPTPFLRLPAGLAASHTLMVSQCHQLLLRAPKPFPSLILQHPVCFLSTS